MIDHKKLRFRSPITGKAKASAILDYPCIAMYLDLPVEDREPVITAVFLHELYGLEAEPDVDTKSLGKYFAIISNLDEKGAEWLHSCERNKENSDRKIR